MSTLRYVVGDATHPAGHGNKIIAHVTNDRGGWGAGFVRALSARWAGPEAIYRSKAPTLGDVDVVLVEPRVWVANLCAQRGYAAPGRRAIDYDVLEGCLESLRDQFHDATVHAPRLGCGLGGGTWTEVEPILRRTLVDHGVRVVIYDLPT